METELLRAFVAVADSGGFSAAARSLNRTQSAVSLQIKRLEDRLGEPLFDRSSRWVTLTEAGGTLLPYARRILRLQEEAADAVGRAAEGPPVRFGLSDDQALAYLPRVLPAFTRSQPDIELEIVCDLSTVLIERLQEGLLDLALTIRHQPTSSGQVVAREPLVWVAAERFRLAPGRPVPLAVNPEGCVFRAQAFAVLSHAGRNWRVTYTSQSATGINLALQAGLAVTIKAARSIPEGCRVLGEADGFPPLQPAEVELHRAPGGLSPAAEAFAEQLLDAIAETEATSMLEPAFALQAPRV